jgi:MFS family permease
VVNHGVVHLLSQARPLTSRLGVWVSFGIFQSHYLSHPRFSSSSSIPTIGTLLSGISWVATPLTNALVIRYVDHRIQMLWLGWSLCIVGLVGASFATQVWHLHLFQGVTYGAGWVIYWSPMLVIINEWWVERRGLAYGIWFTASNASGLVMPFIIRKSLERYDFRITLRLYALASVVVAGLALLMMRPRVRRKGMARMKPFPTLLPPHLLADKHFYLLTAAIFLQSLVYIIPNVFLPSFAESLKLPQDSGPSLLALGSIATICGQMTFGYVADRYHPYILTSISTSICSAAAFLALAATTFSGLGAFSLLWGFFAASYDVLFARICTVLTDDADDALVLYGFLSFERGIAVLLEGSISVVIVDNAEEGYSKYQRLLQLSAWCMLASALCGLGYFRRS